LGPYRHWREKAEATSNGFALFIAPKFSPFVALARTDVPRPKSVQHSLFLVIERVNTSHKSVSLSPHPHTPAACPRVLEIAFERTFEGLFVFHAHLRPPFDAGSSMACMSLRLPFAPTRIDSTVPTARLSPVANSNIGEDRAAVVLSTVCGPTCRLASFECLNTSKAMQEYGHEPHPEP
jgi:hypothetical protein